MIAFFDLDRTILSANSGRLWVARELRLGHVSILDAMRAAAWLTRYHLGFSAMEDALTAAIGRLAGTPEVALTERTREFYEAEVRRLIQLPARAAIAQHRDRGERVVLLTSSSTYLSALVAAELELDAFLCNRFEVGPDGRLTGRSVGELCFGAGKVGYAERYAAGQEATLAETSFYTDSFSDLPLLVRVGQPVAVNPDPRLRRWARRNGWPIHDWRAG